LYVPGFRSSVSVFDSPVIVGVAPSTEPEDDSMFTLWASEAMFVKSIVTLPALAVSEVLSYFSSPDVLAASASVEDAPAGAAVVAAGVEAVVPPDSGAAVLAGVELGELLLEELPQPASTATPAASSAAVTHRRGRLGPGTRDVKLTV
jgi:hypothetical protein